MEIYKIKLRKEDEVKSLFNCSLSPMEKLVYLKARGEIAGLIRCNNSDDWPDRALFYKTLNNALSVIERLNRKINDDDDNEGKSIDLFTCKDCGNSYALCSCV